MQIKVNDIVAVISGKDKFEVDKKGKKSIKTGRVLAVYPKTNKVLVEGVNIVKKHQKPTQQGQSGQIVEKEAPIDASKVMLFDPTVKKPVRVHIVTREENGKIVKVRVSSKKNSHNQYYEFK